MVRPYIPRRVIMKHEDSVHVIGHDNIGAQFNMRKMARDRAPERLGHRSSFGGAHLPLNDLPE